MGDYKQDDPRKYDWWRNALEGRRGDINPNVPMTGFYRRQSKIGSGEIVLTPVAVWYSTNDGALLCLAGREGMSEEWTRSNWPYFSKHPIPHDVYKAVMGGAPWPDVHVIEKPKEADGEHAAAATLDQIMLRDIEAAAAGVAAYKTIDSDEMAVKAQSLRAQLMALGNKADKERDAEKRPHLEAGRAIDAKWKKIVAAANDAALVLRRAMEKWEDDKREAQRRADQAAAKAAAEAQASGEAPPAAPKSNMPAPSTQIKAGGARAASVGTIKVAEITDLDLVYQHFKGQDAIRDLLQKMANAAVNAGITVPGTEVKERATIR